MGTEQPSGPMSYTISLKRCSDSESRVQGEIKGVVNEVPLALYNRLGEDAWHTFLTQANERFGEIDKMREDRKREKQNIRKQVPQCSGFDKQRKFFFVWILMTVVLG